MCDVCDGKSLEQVRRQQLANIAKHDYTIQSVMEEWEDDDVVRPSFSYTVGLWAFHRVPEVIVIGLHDHAPDLIRAYARRVISGERFRTGRVYRSFYLGQAVFEPVDRSFYDEWLCSAFHLYPDGDFPALQLVWQDGTGEWPWEADWAHCEPQPVLTADGRVKARL